MKPGDWIAVADRLPDRHGTYLVYAESADPNSPLTLAVAFFPGEPPETRWGLVDVWSRAVSHWMPIPKPPEPTEGQRR